MFLKITAIETGTRKERDGCKVTCVKINFNRFGS